MPSRRRPRSRSPHGRGIVGDLFDGFFQRHCLLFAYLTAVGLQRGVHDLRYVGANRKVMTERGCFIISSN